VGCTGKVKGRVLEVELLKQEMVKRDSYLRYVSATEHLIVRHQHFLLKRFSFIST
jgi:hypothetical protein